MFKTDSRGNQLYLKSPIRTEMTWKRYYQNKDQLIPVVVTDESGSTFIDYDLDPKLFTDLDEDDNFIAAGMMNGSFYTYIYKVQWRFKSKVNRLFMFHNFRGKTYMRELSASEAKAGTFKVAISSAEQNELMKSGRDWVFMFVHVDENGKCKFDGWNFNLILDNTR